MIPPRSVVECVAWDRRTGAYRRDLGRRYRIGYYGACRDGLGVVWLVDETGDYGATAAPEDLRRYFRVVRRSRETDDFGDDRRPLRALPGCARRPAPEGAAMIKKTAKGYVLYSKDGSRKLGGPYKTRDEALAREHQVQFFKHARGRPR